MHGKKILFLISETFPYGRAYAARTRALVKLFKSAGFSVTVLCDEKSDGADGFTECEISELGGKYSGLKKLLKLPLDYNRRVKELLVSGEFGIVVARSMYDRNDLILHTAKKAGIPFILESCECYNSKSFRKGRADIRYLQFRHCWNRSYKKADGVIAISRYLTDFYKKAGLPVVRVPAVLDTSVIDYSDKAHGKPYRLIYSGDVTGGKELMSEIFVALDSAGRDFVFDIYGPDSKQIDSELSDSARSALLRLGDRVTVHGRVPQSEMRRIIYEADFGIFIRPDRLSSNAGFPTKLGEYLASGLPVITNNTGDISLAVINGENGFIADGDLTESLCDIFEKISAGSDREISKMKINARKSAEDVLNPEVYRDSTAEFLNAF